MDFYFFIKKERERIDGSDSCNIVNVRIIVGSGIDVREMYCLFRCRYLFLVLKMILKLVVVFRYFKSKLLIF